MRPSAPAPVRILAGLVALLFPLPCLLLMEYMNYGGQLEQLHSFFEKHPGSALFACLTIYLLYSILVLLFGRVWPSALLLGLGSVICAYVNYTKAALPRIWGCSPRPET